jgi:hypothetical protein
VVFRGEPGECAKRKKEGERKKSASNLHETFIIRARQELCGYPEKL